MAPREPTRAQLSSRLSYQQNTPAFLLKLQNRMKGITDEEEYDGEGYEEEFEYVSEGREPIPRRPRPPIPQRPTDDPGSADEEEVDENELFPDEKPQVVVLREGKHLTEWEAENIRRKEKGLPPLPKPGSSVATGDLSKSKDSSKESSSSSKTANQGLSFSSSSKTAGGGNSSKRKAIGQLDELKAELNAKANTSSKDKSKVKEKSSSKNSSKKPKKESKTLLSFGDDA